jgi:hypothetical protein
LNDQFERKGKRPTGKDQIGKKTNPKNEKSPIMNDQIIKKSRKNNKKKGKKA